MKTYLRYEPNIGSGIVCSSRSNSILIHHGRSTLAITPSYECASLWDLMKGEIRTRFVQRKETDGEVTCLATFLDSDENDVNATATLVIGRTRGRVDLHDFKPASQKMNETSSPRASLVGHSSSVTCACFNADGSRLATGGSDTFVVIWDPTTETGLYRLRGHKDEVTCLRFVSVTGQGELISSSKDTSMKIWDLETQHCAKTITDHPTGVWSFDSTCTGSRKRIVTGCSDGLIRSIDLDAHDVGAIMPGPLNRQTSERVETLVVCEDMLVIQSAGRVIEFYRIRNDDKASKKQKRRLRRLREKSKETTEEDEQSWTQDEIELACVLRTPHRARSVSLRRLSGGDGQGTDQYLALITYTNNLVELYTVNTTLEEGSGDGEDGDDEPADKGKKKAKMGKLKEVTSLEIRTRLELQGHRTDIRCVALGDDDELALTAADGAIKLWNVATGVCLRTMKSGFSLCCAFSQNSLHSFVGTKEGALLVHNLNDGSIQKEIENAHDGEPIYSLDLRPDGMGMVTCGGDRQCKFWDFKQASGTGLTLLHKRTLRLGDSGDAQCVRYTRGAKKSEQLKVCVALLDSTVKVFHEDSLEFALSLYGHKLPVLTMDSSDDGQILATGSSDKSIKIWGLDFGDCHRSVFAHEGSVTCVRFVPKTHYLVSAGRDGKVRYWDCDANLERILSFDFAHYGDVWGLTIARDASCFLSVGKDKRIRKYTRTRDLVFVDEERAKEMERQMEMERDGDDAAEGAEIAGGVIPNAPLMEESLSVSRKTLQAIEVGDRIAEVLTTLVEQPGPEDEDEETRLERIGVQIAKTCRQSSAQDLQDALVFMPFVHVVPLIISFAFALKARVEVELISKSALTLVKIHGGRLVGAKERDAVELLKKHMRDALWELRDLIGTNAAGLRWLDRRQVALGGFIEQ